MRFGIYKHLIFLLKLNKIKLFIIVSYQTFFKFTRKNNGQEKTNHNRLQKSQSKKRGCFWEAI